MSTDTTTDRRALSIPIDRFFYHSFPRPRTGVDSVSKGLQILASILDRGLVLTPERIEFNERLQGGSPSAPYQMFAKRACFTELPPSELKNHSNQFGPFAIEWDAATFRRIGGNPVFYVALGADDEPGGVAASLLARLHDIQVVLARLEGLAVAVRTSDSPARQIVINRAGKSDPIACTASGAADLLSYLQHDLQPVASLTSAVSALAGFFSPTENLKYTAELAYYRQREWRIIANVVKDGFAVSSPPSPADRAALLAIDADFFGKVLEFTSGKHALVDQSQFFRTFEGRPLRATFRRLVCPRAALPAVEELLRERHVSLPITALEDLSA